MVTASTGLSSEDAARSSFERARHDNFRRHSLVLASEVAVQDHRTTYLVADVDAVRGGLGSFAVSSSQSFIKTPRHGSDSRHQSEEPVFYQPKRIDAPYRLQDWHRQKPA